jgi:hypothetical protein
MAHPAVSGSLLSRRWYALVRRHLMETERAQDEDGPRPWNEDALKALRLDWGWAYRIGHDAVRDWWAQRRDGLGGDITAGTHDELRTAISDDYTLKAVPRELAGYRSTGITRS